MIAGMSHWVLLLLTTDQAACALSGKKIWGSKRKKYIYKDECIINEDKIILQSFYTIKTKSIETRGKNRGGTKGKSEKENRICDDFVLFCVFFYFLWRKKLLETFHCSVLCQNRRFSINLALYLKVSLCVPVCVKLLEKILYMPKNKVSCLPPICVYF
jgi:hypothetical protein